jgi:hypothetical protein
MALRRYSDSVAFILSLSPALGGWVKSPIPIVVEKSGVGLGPAVSRIFPNDVAHG